MFGLVECASCFVFVFFFWGGGVTVQCALVFDQGVSAVWSSLEIYSFEGKSFKVAASVSSKPTSMNPEPYTLN